MLHYIVDSDDKQVSEYFGTKAEAVEKLKRSFNASKNAIRSAEGNIEDKNYFYLSRRRVKDTTNPLKIIIAYFICDCNGKAMNPPIENEAEARRVLESYRECV